MAKIFKPKAEGFTLIELIIAIAIMGILMGLALPNLRGFMQSGRLSVSSQVVEAMMSEARSETRSRRVMMAIIGQKDAQQVEAYACNQVFNIEGDIECACVPKNQIYPLEGGVKLKEGFAMAFFPPHGDIFIPENESELYETCVYPQGESKKEQIITLVEEENENNKINLKVLAGSGLIEKIKNDSP